ncbi:hypothetical protein B0H11DRAFT_1921777 [Mycena galericulata]|nr:hypothetical protein B0H11DRAFT_1921777 [Mycena galericulata]
MPGCLREGKFSAECEAELAALNDVDDADEAGGLTGSFSSKILDLCCDGVKITLPFFRDLLADNPVDSADAIRSLSEWSAGVAVDVNKAFWWHPPTRARPRGNTALTPLKLGRSPAILTALSGLSSGLPINAAHLGKLFRVGIGRARSLVDYDIEAPIPLNIYPAPACMASRGGTSSRSMGVIRSAAAWLNLIRTRVGGGLFQAASNTCEGRSNHSPKVSIRSALFSDETQASLKDMCRPLLAYSSSIPPSRCRTESIWRPRSVMIPVFPSCFVNIQFTYSPAGVRAERKPSASVPPAPHSHLPCVVQLLGSDDSPLPSPSAGLDRCRCELFCLPQHLLAMRRWPRTLTRAECRAVPGTGGTVHYMDHKQNVAGLEAVAEPEIIAPLIPQEPCPSCAFRGFQIPRAGRCFSLINTIFPHGGPLFNTASQSTQTTTLTCASRRGLVLDLVKFRVISY